MTEEEILALCSDKNVLKFEGEAPYWASEIYGFGQHIRDYGFYPKKWPLILFTEHSGPVMVDKFNYFETSHDAPTVMFHSPERVKKWRQQFDKACYNLYSPFVFYRRKNNITVSPKAKGTLAYPSHSIPDLDIVSGLEEYIQQLKNLPEEYHPVSVSLHYHDINSGLYKLFLKHGLPVYTAGTPFDYRFTKRFYSILQNFKYTTSNALGSYIFYSTEMGIPFFMHGTKPEYRKNTDTKVADEALGIINTKDEVSECITTTFSHMTGVISQEQKDMTYSILGLNDGVSRLKMASILYYNYAAYYMKEKSVTLKEKTALLKRVMGAIKRKLSL
jgi:hypothetical protein